MATWAKLMVEAEDYGPRIAQRILDRFNECLIADAGKHPSAAIFKQRTLDSQYVYYYFSPDACLIAAKMLIADGPELCVMPDCPSTHNDGVHQVAGDPSAVALLWPEEVSASNGHA